MRRALWGMGLGLGLATVALTLAMVESDAKACGGCFNPPENPTVVTDHRMIYSVSKTQSTLYDQIKYTGDPASFAWVLPISGTVDVGLSADIMFSSLDSQTQMVLQPPPLNCPPPPSNCRSFGAANGGSSSGSSGSGGVTVLKKEVVGPYETVQLKPDAANPKALQDWLTLNKFTIPPDVVPVIDKYQAESFNFLALRLTPGQGVRDMRPVRVSTQGANVALPLRMVAAGTGPTVGITLWIVSEGRYEPQNFPSFTIATDEIVWDWAQQKSNYTELRAQKTAAGGGKIWEIETSLIFYRQQIESTIKNGSYNGSGPPPTTDEDRAKQDYLEVKDPQTQVVTKTAAQVRDEDINTLFYGIATANSRVTRLRADLAHAALDTDIVMQASAQQTELPRVRQITKEKGQPNCPVFSGCDQTGTAPRDQVAGNGGGSAGGSTFVCAATAIGDNGTWMGVGLAFASMAIAHAIRRRHRDRRR